MRFLLLIIATTSLFAQKEYDIDDIYFSAPIQVYIKKFSDEIVDGNFNPPKITEEFRKFKDVNFL